MIVLLNSLAVAYEHNIYRDYMYKYLIIDKTRVEFNFNT